MNRVMPEVIDYYDNEVSKRIMKEHNVDELKALKMFVCSKTHSLLEDIDTGLLSFGAEGIFDIWKAENETGEPTNSIYLSEE